MIDTTAWEIWKCLYETEYIVLDDGSVLKGFELVLGNGLGGMDSPRVRTTVGTAVGITPSNDGIGVSSIIGYTLALAVDGSELGPTLGSALGSAEDELGMGLILR